MSSTNLKASLTILCILLITLEVDAQNIAQDSLYIHYYSTPDYRASEISYSATEDENGIIYFANENGVVEFDGSHWKLHQLPDFSYVNVVEAGDDGRIYIGGRDEFGFMQRDSTGDMSFTSLRAQLDSTIALNECWQIEYFQGQAYFQTYEGLVRWDGEISHFIDLKDSWFLPMADGMYVSVIMEGIGKLVGDSVQYVNSEIRYEEDNPHAVLPFLGSEKLVPTEFNGLHLMDTITHEVRKWEVPVNELLEEHGIWSSKVWDDSTYLFSVINHALVWVNKKGEIVKTFGEPEGIKPSEITNFLKDSRGNLWIPGYGIHHVIWPERQDLTSTNTLIRSIVVDRAVLNINSANDTIDLGKPEPLKDVLFTFATPGVDQKDLEFSTRLEGFEEEWSAWNSNPMREFTNLDGGNYTFSVRSRLRTGREFETANLSFQVSTPWHHTGWAKFAGGVAIWLIVMGLFKIRTVQLKQKNELLERTVAQRTKELSTANELLGKKNHELDQFVRRVSHDLVAPMKSVKALMQITREETEKEQEKCFDMMELSLDKQEHFIRKMLDQAVNYREVKNVLVFPFKICIDSLNSLSHFEGMNEIEIDIQVPADFSFISDPDRFKIVTNNLITNAIKYRDEGKKSYLNITHEMTQREVIFHFEDNGSGIVEKELSKIFEMFKRATVQSHGTGLGLYIVKDIMTKLGGNVDVTSVEGEGSTFSVYFPIISETDS